MNMLIRITLLTLSLCGATVAQESIPISERDIDRLGIRFSAVETLQRHSGDRFPGQVTRSPEAQSTLRPAYGGYVQQWAVGSGDSVQAGDLVAVLRSESLLGIQQQWLDARVRADQAASSLQRDQRLFDAGVIAQQRLEQTRREHQQAVNAVRSAEGRLTVAGVSAADREALLDDPSALGMYRLRAPLSGVLTHRASAVGNHVPAGAVLATFDARERLWVGAWLPARVARNLSIGDVLDIAESDEAVRVQQRDFQVEAGSQMVHVYARFEGDVGLMIGEIINLVVPPDQTGVLVPSSAVARDGQDTLVFVRTEGGVEVRRLGLQPAGADYVANSGLRPGELVVSQGAAAIKGMMLGLGGGE
ncbi:MAG: efflux RND transporter periplasmic adaptor subunit [Pseudomonadota bacterium]